MYKGESAKRAIKVNVSGVPIVLDTAAGENLIIILYIADKKVKTFNLINGDIIHNAVDQQYEYVIERSDSLTFPTGKLFREALVKLNDASFAGGYHSIGVEEIDIIKPAKSVTE